MNIIDTHCHAFPDFLAEKALNALSEHSGDYKPHIEGKISDLLISMDKAGILTAFIANIATKPEQAEPIVKWSKEIHSKRIIPLGSFHPTSVNWQHDIDMIKAAGLPGIKLHPMYQNFEVDEKNMLEKYEYIMNKKLFILFHSGYDIAFPGDTRAKPFRFKNIKKLFPDLKIISSHIGGWQDWNDVLEYEAGLDIYFETSFINEIDKSLFQKIFNKHDKNKFLFGTDSPWLNQKQEADNILKLNFSADITEKIFYKNAEQLLKSADYKFM